MLEGLFAARTACCKGCTSRVHLIAVTNHEAEERHVQMVDPGQRLLLVVALQATLSATSHILRASMRRGWSARALIYRVAKLIGGAKVNDACVSDHAVATASMAVCMKCATSLPSTAHSCSRMRSMTCCMRNPRRSRRCRGATRPLWLVFAALALQSLLRDHVHQVAAPCQWQAILRPHIVQSIGDLLNERHTRDCIHPA